jgi:predicted component of type VI protein secretion system
MELPSALHRATPSELKERLEAERGGPFLLYRDGDDAQRILPLTDAPERLTIGRRPTCGVPLPWDGEVSRLHAVLERLEDEWTLVDDGRSRNGSFVNGERIQGRSRLRDGDTIRVGRSTMIFRSASGGESLRTETSDRHAVGNISEAQRRVLTALCRPYAQSDFGVPASNRQIADELVVSVATVKTHLQALFDAFGVRALPQHQKRAALASRALETGVVSARDLEPGG